MSIVSIDNIRTNKNLCLESLRGVGATDFPQTTTGKENEFNTKSFLSILTDLIIDITALTKSPTKFAKVSTLAERNNMASQLARLNSAITQRNLSSILAYYEQIKIVVRLFKVEFVKEKSKEYEDFVSSLSESTITLSRNTKQLEGLVEINEEKLGTLSKKEEELVEKIDKLEEREKDLLEKINGLDEKTEQLENLIEKEEEKSLKVAEILAEVKGKSETVESFSKRVASRENQLDAQETKTDEYTQKLDEFVSERKNYLDEAEELIKTAKLALEYKTAEGLSAAFQTRQNDIEKSSSWLWLVGAIAFLGAVIFISISLLANEELSANTVLSRITMVPLLVAGIWFCAGQYVKMQNIAEDYAFKAVLAKSMVGFSDQLSDSADKGEAYNQFVLSAMEQIHKDPLRKHSIKSQEIEADVKKLGMQRMTKELSDLMKLKGNLENIIPKP